MTITAKSLASAMLVPTRQATIPTGAGRSVRFASGIATINNTDDLPYLLARDDVKIMFTEYAMSWLPDVLRATRKLNALAIWPPGWEVNQTGERSFSVVAPDPDDEDDDSEDEGDEGEEEEPEAVVHDALDEVLKVKRRWQSRPSN